MIRAFVPRFASYTHPVAVTRESSVQPPAKATLSDLPQSQLKLANQPDEGASHRNLAVYYLQPAMLYAIQIVGRVDT